MSWSPVIEILGYYPEGDPTRQGVILEASNLVPTDRGYRSAFSLTDTGTDTLTATCVGAMMLQKADGSFLTMAGTATELFVRDGVAWTNITRTTSDTYAASIANRWHFAAMGDYIMAATASTTIQVSLAGATFTTITGAPKAAVIETVNGFAFAANTIDAAYGTSPDRWWCSGLNDHTDWTPAVATQCTTGRLVDTPGPIRGLRRLGRDVVAYKDFGVYLGQYTEPPTTWQWSLMSTNVGCASHDAVMNIGRAHLFMSNEDFFIFDGTTLQSIGDPIRRFFFAAELTRSYDAYIQAVHDAPNAIVYWFYVSGGSTALDKAVAYNYRTNRWGIATYATQCVVEHISSITYDSLGGYFSTYDSGIIHTYDSPFWISDLSLPAVIGADGLLKTITGTSGASSFALWRAGDDATFTLFRGLRVRWLRSPTTATATLYTANNHGETMSVRTSNSLADGKFDLLASARWHQVKVETTGDAEFAMVSADVVPQGAH